LTLIDSDVLIAHLRGHPAATDFLLELRRRGPRPAISAVTVAEISGGMRSGERPAVWRLLASLVVEPVDDIVARKAGELMRAYRRSHRAVGTADYLIAATAITTGHELVTLNVRHFPMFEHLQPPFSL
jgi:predicted nucleic acid-binding protein